MPTSKIIGNVGASPITGAAIGLTCAQVTGKIDTVAAAGPGGACHVVDAAALTTAVSDMDLAYTNAKSRAPNATELYAGNLGDRTLTPGVYKFSTGVLIPRDMVLEGSADAVWIFEIAQGLTVADSVEIVMADGANPKNVFWAVSGIVTIGTAARFKGIVLTHVNVSVATGASIDGRLYAGTAITLEQNAVTAPVSP